MAGLDDLGIKALSMRVDGKARALLNEIAALLQNLLTEGDGGSVDLARIPLTDEDYDLLEDVLGEGEVTAEVNALGPTQIVETGVPGVWWVTHYNADDEVMAEFIEVAYCPEILLSPREDVQEGLDALQARLLEERLITKGENHGE
jgi:hydrogenase-1 operon protein HyaF